VKGVGAIRRAAGSTPMLSGEETGRSEMEEQGDEDSLEALKTGRTGSCACQQTDNTHMSSEGEKQKQARGSLSHV